MLLEQPDRTRGVKTERILRVLLNTPDGTLSKYRIAQEVEASEPWVLEYTGRLEDRGLIENTRVLKPRELYAEWRDVRVTPNQLSVSLQQPMDLLDKTTLDYALTTYQAENLAQGLLFPSTTDFYIRPDQAAEWMQLIEEKGLLGGGNVRLRVTDEHVFYQTERRDRYTVVSSPQLILDLLEEGGPCAEAAETLIDSVHSGGS
ncbi:MAG: Lrp/AsnC family transcriptional regulator [Natrialbaceae archaeon]|nr:Lrp/AsnC family transcriptional regulator [Natrialbaceae archaeon]